jgi:type IV pilus assembly protein PilA
MFNMKKSPKNHGFTLIELMIVIAILAILAAFALPVYGDYTKRTYVSEGLALASSAQSAVVDTYASTGVAPNMNNVAGLANPNRLTGQAVKSILVTGQNNIPLITITYNTKVKDGTKLALAMDTTPNMGSYRWVCGFASNEGTNVLDSAKVNTTVSSQWLPSNCRSA